jgi:hypothetical protein
LRTGKLVIFLRTPDINKLKEKREMGNLVKVLEYFGTPGIRLDAAKALDELGWQSTTDKEKSLYFLAKKDWNNVKKYSEPAVKLLLGELGYSTPITNDAWSENKRPIIDRGLDAANALGMIGSDKAIIPLLDHIEHAWLYEWKCPYKEEIVKKLISALEKMDRHTTESVIAKIIDQAAGYRSPAEQTGHPAMILAGPSSSHIQGLKIRLLSLIPHIALYPLLEALNATQETKPKLAFSPYTFVTVKGASREDRQKFAATAFNNIGQSRAGTLLLVRTLIDNDHEIRRNALEAAEILFQHGEIFVDSIFSLHEVKGSIVRAERSMDELVNEVIQMLNDRATVSLIQALRSDDWASKKGYLVMMGSSAQPRLREALKEGHAGADEFRKRIVETINEISTNATAESHFIKVEKESEQTIAENGNLPSIDHVLSIIGDDRFVRAGECAICGNKFGWIRKPYENLSQLYEKYPEHRFKKLCQECGTRLQLAKVKVAGTRSHQIDEFQHILNDFGFKAEIAGFDEEECKIKLEEANINYIIKTTLGTMIKIHFVIELAKRIPKIELTLRKKSDGSGTIYWTTDKNQNLALNLNRDQDLMKKLSISLDSRDFLSQETVSGITGRYPFLADRIFYEADGQSIILTHSFKKMPPKEYFQAMDKVASYIRAFT